MGWEEEWEWEEMGGEVEGRRRAGEGTRHQLVLVLPQTHQVSGQLHTLILSSYTCTCIICMLLYVGNRLVLG